MEPVRILIAISNELSVNKLKTILVESGYTVVDIAKEGNETLRKIRALKPDMVVLDYNLPLLSGYEVAKVAIEDKICDAILIVTDDQKNLMYELNEQSGFTCVVKPINSFNLINTIELMVKNRRKINKLEKEVQDLKNILDTRKEVEKAKGLLMKHLSLSEQDAFKRIQKQSMDKGIPMKEIAKAIILAYDI